MFTALDLVPLVHLPHEHAVWWMLIGVQPASTLFVLKCFSAKNAG